jgi:hypothetical protein
MAAAGSLFRSFGLVRKLQERIMCILSGSQTQDRKRKRLVIASAKQNYNDFGHGLL